MPDRDPDGTVDEALERVAKAWSDREPGKLVGRGHPVGDFLEAHEWDVLEEREGVIRVRAHLPERVRNPRGQLFGGFTPTYVDFIAIHTFRAGRDRDAPRGWLATLNMRVDYFAPVVTDRFELDSRVVHRRGASCWIETRFLGPAGDLLAYALTTLREADPRNPIADGPE